MGLRIWPEFNDFGQIIEVQAGSGQATHKPWYALIPNGLVHSINIFPIFGPVYLWMEQEQEHNRFLSHIWNTFIADPRECSMCYIESLPSSQEKKASVFPAVGRLYFLFLVL